MKRSTHTWILFGVCAAALFGALGWVTVTALRLNEAEAEARRQAVVEETVRLALWRMDSALTLFLAKEGARPYFAYASFYPAERAYTRMFAQLERGEILVPSPLLTESSPYVKLHFQFGPDGAVTSPQAPTGNMRDLAEVSYLEHETIEASIVALDELKRRVSRDRLTVALGREPERPAVEVVRFEQREEKADVQQKARQMIANEGEFIARSQQVSSNIAVLKGKQPSKLDLAPQVQAVPAFEMAPLPLAMSEVVAGVLRPVWVDRELVLARQVSIEGKCYVQGCWLDWPAIRSEMLASVRDLAPDGRLVPANPVEEPGDPGHMLAALPARFVPGTLPPVRDGSVSPVELALVTAWAAAALASLAIALLLRGVLSLSERRAAFVSAVTHELRTPLTTFRMYTEMLADGMVRGEDKRKQYVDTLHAESNRLSHLVENVLAYARLERGRHGNALETTTIGALLDRMTDRLAQRAGQAGFELVVAAQGAASAAQLETNSAAVEQILMNLVDNACKYAVTGADRRIHLETTLNDGALSLRVRDHGPGVADGQAKRLFRPFSKSARDAANAAPGIGLGLTLSRRLARGLGGDLRHVPSNDGACFELTLPTMRG